MEEGEQVMSEVHLGCSPHEFSCLSTFTIAESKANNNVNARLARERCAPEDIHGPSKLDDSLIDDFNVTMDTTPPSEQPAGKYVLMDESGDLVVPRRRRSCMHNVDTKECTIIIHHHVKTTLTYVGLQVWKASLLLGDFLLHKMQTTSELNDVIGLELGAGTGILGILLAAKAGLVYLTDLDVDVLDNCYRNLLLNSRKSKKIAKTLRIRQLDWLDSWPPNAGCNDEETSTNSQSLLVCLPSMDVHAQWKATTTSPPKPDSKKQYSEKALEEEVDARLARILGAQKQGKKRKKSTDFPGYLGSQSTFDKAKKHKKHAEVPSSSSSSGSSSDSSEEERKGNKKTRKSKSRRVDDSSTEDTSTDSSDSEDGHFYANKKNFYKANQYDFLEDEQESLRV
ncbi:hypothetical protein L7F22_035077 [Adiantum nelumboides]|nr:hypothetical protein [Adiantum nelumboides]